MPIRALVPDLNPARDDVQQTDFGYDVVGRYICNNWQEITAAQGPGAYPFDVVVIGAGMFGGYCAEKLYRLGARFWPKISSPGHGGGRGWTEYGIEHVEHGSGYRCNRR